MFKAKALATALLVLAAATSANALTWQWSSNSGQEAGTFTTDGDALNGAAGTYTFTGFTLDQSSLLDVNQLTTAFVFDQGGAQTMEWDGNAATKFTRNNGVYTNGANFFALNANVGSFGNIIIGFGINGSNSIADTDYTPYHSFSDLTISLAPTAAVPLPAALPLSLAALGGLAAIARRKNG